MGVDAPKSSDINSFPVMRGAGYLHSGSYGCAFTPSIPCALGDERSKDAVSKVFRRSKYAKQEEELMERVARIDPSALFTVPLLSKCDGVTRAKLLKEKNAKKCSYITGERPPYSLLTFANAGINLQTLMNDIRFGGLTLDMRAFARGMESLIYGIVVLAKNKMVHCDLSYGNVMVKLGSNARDGGALDFRIIDWGMLVNSDGVYVPDQSNKHSHSYFPYPPEFRLATDASRSASDFYEAVLANFSSSMLEAHVGAQGASRLQSDLAALHKRYAEKRPSYRVMLKSLGKLWNKVDVYGIGINMELLLQYHGRPSQNEDVPLYQDMLKLTSAMCRADPAKRLSPFQAYKKYLAMLASHGLEPIIGDRSLVSSRSSVRSKSSTKTV